MPYDEEVMKADRVYQEEGTVQSELALERARLKFWEKKLKEDPDNKDFQHSVKYHRGEVERLEKDVKLL
jgi:hypothetical protein